jgi:hypothetical protein
MQIDLHKFVKESEDKKWMGVQYYKGNSWNIIYEYYSYSWNTYLYK